MAKGRAISTSTSFEFHVLYEDGKIAVGRFQYVPGRAASQKR